MTWSNQARLGPSAAMKGEKMIKGTRRPGDSLLTRATKHHGVFSGPTSLGYSRSMGTTITSAQENTDGRAWFQELIPECQDSHVIENL